ncbi:flagellar filament capping protein FliD [Halalkalibacter okhensis]|uniref:Flagellar hook-associated protein 2 n=1 Tax=Halalkalibacter okhensis TaxID=333138 RepID=A0A0B0IDV2_9BACI|nr:flagellar filament capping protein FliD [Halalkalibacter okhensis]KHF37831.1 hypothetical protein LQ50_25150 [Halalkalibacter okhensis]
MRITGMATGMDINQIVTDLMRAQRMPVDKMIQDRQIIEWQMEDYREINRKLDAFRTNIFDTVMRQNIMQSKSVTSSNDSLVTATASSTAGNMSIRVSSVQQLAKAATYSSQTAAGSGISGETKISASGALGSQKFDVEEDFWKSGVVNRQTIRQSANSNVVDLNRTDIINTGDMVVKVNGKVYDVVSSTSEVELEDNQVRLNPDDGKLYFKSRIAQGTSLSTVFITEAPEGSTDPKHRYTAAGVTTFNAIGIQRDKFVFTSDQTLTAVFNELNRSSVGINGFYDEFSDKITVSRSTTGTFNEGGQEIEFEGAFLRDALKLNFDPVEDPDEPETMIVYDHGAQNAKFNLNGLETERRSNTFTVSGMTVTLRDTFDGEVNLKASTDTDKVFDTIKKFVDDYNEILDLVNGKLKEERYRDYRPLTDEQKDAMSEKEIEKWEERARSGLLRGDSAMRSAVDRMRMDLYSPVNGQLSTAFNQLTTIGIKTTANYMDGGKLEIDEDKLRQAIEQDVEGVFQLFAANGETDGEKGIARRLRSTLDGAIGAIADRAGGMRGKVQNNQFALGRNLTRINDQISNFERRLQQVEERYWRQFNAMDAAVNRANQQAEALFAQLFPQG